MTNLLLRTESFGGLVFDPHDATLLELDSTGFAELNRAMTAGIAADRGRATCLTKHLNREIPNWLDRTRMVRELPPLEADLPGVLRAPTLVDFQITTRCDQGCPHCYASSTFSGIDVPLNDARQVLQQCEEAGVCQIAFGGGEPLLHPNIELLLYEARSHNLVPNLTTSGAHLTKERIAILRETCGAVALSQEGIGADYSRWRKQGFAQFEHSLQQLIEADIRTVVQVTLAAENIESLPKISEYLAKIPLYGVIFLAFKPVGRGTTFGSPLSQTQPELVLRHLADAFTRLSPSTRVGYDCCLSPAIAALALKADTFDSSAVEGCSALRGSLGIDPHLNVMPCTFLAEPDHHIGNIHNKSLLDLWRGTQAEDFRKRHLCRSMSTPCRDCAAHSSCLAGCPKMPLVNCSVNGT